MLSIKDLAADRRDIVVRYGEHEVHVTYRPSVITTEFLDRHRAASMNVMIADAVDKWDVVDEDDSPFPLTAERVGTLPVAFQRCVWWEGVIADNNTVGLPEVPVPSDAS